LNEKDSFSGVKKNRGNKMRKLTINTFVTLDGIMQAPGGPEEDPSGGFKYGGWSVNYWDDMMGQVMGDSMAKPFDLLLGRKTYEIFAAHWPFIKNDPVADKFNTINKYVVSKSLKNVDWKNSFIIKNNVVQEIIKLKEKDGPELQVHGSGNLIQTLIKENLIDEFRLWIFPVLLGNGKRLFGEGTNALNLQLADTKSSTAGVIISTYLPGGDLKTGSFALEKTTSAEPACSRGERRKKLKEETKILNY
jgi:dihydrofolate reductase